MTLRVRIVRVTYESGYALLETYSGLEATRKDLEVEANNYNGQYFGWELCAMAGKYAINQLALGWAVGAVLSSSSGGNGTIWDLQVGGAAISVDWAGNGFEAYVDVYPEVPPADQLMASITLCNDTSVPATGVALEFIRGRTEILSLDDHDWFLDGDFIKAARFKSEAVPPGGSITLEVLYRLDPPSFRITPRPRDPEFMVTWLSPQGGPLTSTPDKLSRLPSPLHFDESAKSFQDVADYVAAHDLTIAEIKAARLADIGTSRGAVLRYKRFFATLDEQTNPKLGATGPVRYVPFMRVLQARFLRRARAAVLPGPALVWPSIERELLRHDAGVIAGRMQSWMRQEIGDLLRVRVGPVGRPGQSFATCEEALEMWASGALTSFDAFGAPDGPMAFAFGEFGLLLLELLDNPRPTQYRGRRIAWNVEDIDGEFWRPLVPVLCRLAEIFARCYHRPLPANHAERYKFESYTPLDNPNGRRGLNPYGADVARAAADAAMLDAIRTSWRGNWPGNVNSIADKFGLTVASALRQELVGVPAGAVFRDLPDHAPELAGREKKCWNHGPRGGQVRSAKVSGGAPRTRRGR
jgi:hypothetical protein